MGLIGFEIVDNQPAVAFERHDCPFVVDGTVAVVFTLPKIFGLLEDIALRPIRPCEATDHGHLVFTVYGDGVVRRGTGESVAPDAFAGVEIGSGVDGDIVVPHPQIHMELVGVGRAGGEVGTAQDGTGVGVAKDVDSPIGECFTAKLAKGAKF